MRIYQEDLKTMHDRGYCCAKGIQAVFDAAHQIDTIVEIMAWKNELRIAARVVNRFVSLDIQYGFTYQEVESEYIRRSLADPLRDPISTNELWYRLQTSETLIGGEPEKQVYVYLPAEQVFSRDVLTVTVPVEMLKHKYNVDDWVSAHPRHWTSPLPARVVSIDFHLLISGYPDSVGIKKGSGVPLYNCETQDGMKTALFEYEINGLAEVE